MAPYCEPNRSYYHKQKMMNYYLNKILKGKSFDEAIEQVTAGLKKEGFGVLTEIDVKETLKTKIDVDFKKYKILGACNPHFAYKVLQSEDKGGVFLPCNVIVEEHENGEVEVAVINPNASLGNIKNEKLDILISEVFQKLKKVIQNLD